MNRFGGHRSPLLVEMTHDLSGPGAVRLAARLTGPVYPSSDSKWGDGGARASALTFP